tara:strand:+ start:129 stop:716 length:588 start_codon:yes stop_codon:yes gene_type:complete
MTFFFFEFLKPSLTLFQSYKSHQANPVVVVCHEDRAFLCRTCDVSIHSANDFVAKHQRFLFSGVGLQLESVGQGKSNGKTQQTNANKAREIAEAHFKPSMEPPQAQTTQNKRSKGKRKAQESNFDDDALVPSLAGPSSSGGSGAQQMAPDDEFNSFVADFVKGGAAADADFLDTFFDDIPAGFREDDFGVVPTFR